MQHPLPSNAGRHRGSAVLSLPPWCLVSWHSTPGGHSRPHPAAPCSTSGLFITSQQEMMSPLFPANSSTDGSLYPDRILHLTFRTQRCFLFFIFQHLKIMFFFLIFFFFLLYNIVLVLPYINMHPPRVYTCSPSWTPLPPPSPYHPSGSSQCTSPKLPVSCIEPGLVFRFLYDIHVLMPFSQIIPPSSLSHRVQKTVQYRCFLS